MPHTPEHKTYSEQEVLNIYRKKTGNFTTDWEDYENALALFAENVESGEVPGINPYNKGPEGAQFIDKKSTEEPNYEETVKEVSYPVLDKILSFTPMNALASGQTNEFLKTFGTEEQKKDLAEG